MISLIGLIVLVVVDRIIRFHPLLPGRRIFSGDDRALDRLTGLRVLSELEEFVLDDPCKRNFSLSVVHYGVALVIINIRKLFALKSQ